MTVRSLPAGLITLLGLGIATMASAQSGSAVATFLLAQQSNPYVSSAMCVRCHASYESSLTGSPHEDFDSISEHGCQTCHGPGRAHVQNPEDPARQPRMEAQTVDSRREACFGCHDDTGHDREHFQAAQACESCHTVHDFDAGVTGAAGDARCLTCHEGAEIHGGDSVRAAGAPATDDPGGEDELTASFQSRGTPHSALVCADCHTLGSLSEQTWVGRAGTERCMDCHADDHPRYFASSHARAGLECKSCHSVHSGALVNELAPNSYLGRSSQQCTECHATIVTEFTFNERHRLEEGIMECSSCHNPHEPTQRVRLGGFKSQQCTQCHVDKMGPFVFEHGTSITEGCVSCHVPHGSPNRHMLHFQSVADQCYSCHFRAPGFHAGFTSETLCTNCHSAVHGSNLHPFFLK